MLCNHNLDHPLQVANLEITRNKLRPTIQLQLYYLSFASRITRSSSDLR